MPEAAQLQEPVQKLIFENIPCNLLVIKSILFLLCFSSVLILAKIGELFNKKDGWLTGFFALVFTNAFYFRFFDYENDTFSYPLLLVGLYYFAKKDYVKALFFVGIAGLIWHGAIFYVIAFGLTWWPAMVIAGIILLIVNPMQLAVLLPNVFLGENMPIIGMTNLKFTIIGFVTKYMPFFRQIFFFCVIGFMNGKYAFHLIPLLSISCMLLYAEKNKRIIASSLNDKFYFFLLENKFKVLNNAQMFLVLIGLSCYLAGLPQIFEAMPTQADWNAIKTTMSYGLPIQNDWDYGYWIAWARGKPSAWGGGEYNNYSGSGVRLTMFFQKDCELLKDFNTFKVYTDQKTVGVWKC
jgi:hypothetical protein